LGKEGMTQFRERLTLGFLGHIGAKVLVEGLLGVSAKRFVKY